MTTSAHGASGFESDKPRLGQLLVDLGLLSVTDLEAVLVRQRETGLPLGRMLVEGGYVAAHSIAMALADQHGGLLKTEYGFATGRTPIRLAEPPQREPSAPSAAESEPEEEEAIASSGLRLAGRPRPAPSSEANAVLPEPRTPYEELEAKLHAAEQDRDRAREEAARALGQVAEGDHEPRGSRRRWLRSR